ncbi:hypothetical protein HRI_001702900 [Hibiscus trionum]|uniref:Reverse transcriptase zinc-binding domain-containing protein n=1 Tax=Hibiscus trionum TaxID=183268 RepID=A0A9W7HNJ3_HIBTR|nr:hypothetical protein HRI_001702900 [Hibiscus trionum]
MDQVLVLEEVLRHFSGASGQKVSIAKTSIYFSKNVDQPLRDSISSYFGFRQVSDLGRYLGVPLLHKRVTKASYQYVVQRVRDKLSGWSAKSMSLAGRITLANSVLSSILFYVMQSTLLPKGTCQEIEQLIRSFIWGRSAGGGGISLVNWQSVCSPSSKGCLGFKSLAIHNEAFLMKICFNLVRSTDQFWVQVLRSKYKWCTSVPLTISRPRCSHLWKGVSLVWEDVRNSLIWSVGDGHSVDFWRDMWLGEVGALRDHVSDSSLRDGLPLVSVADMVADNGSWRWPAFQHLLPQVILMRLAAVLPPQQVGVADGVGWKWEARKEFSVRSAYQVRSGSVSSSSESVWKVINHFRGLQRIKVFLWLLGCGKLLTNDERLRRYMAANSHCGVCGTSGESVDHLFRTCPSVFSIWVSLIHPSKLSEFLSINVLEWLHINLSKPTYFACDSSDWDLRFGAILWSIWKFRNTCIFDPDAADTFNVLEHSRWCVNESVQALSISAVVSSSSSTGLGATAKWVKPPMGWLKLNTNGAREVTSGFASCGGVGCDNHGVWRFGFAKFVGICSPLEAELWGVFVGLCQAWLHGFRKVVVEVDCREACLLLSRS